MCTAKALAIEVKATTLFDHVTCLRITGCNLKQDKQEPMKMRFSI